MYHCELHERHFSLRLWYISALMLYDNLRIYILAGLAYKYLQRLLLPYMDLMASLVTEH